jgi:uncharacterized damage-inducible protein DinB
MNPPISNLGDVVRGDLAAYVRHLASRVDTMVRALPEDRLWIKPFPYGNSVGNLVLHLTGNLSHYVGATLAKTGYVRDRPREFSDPGGYPAREILQRFHEAATMVIQVIQSRSDANLCGPIPDQPPIQSEFGLLLVVASHLNNHIGQMSYLVRALGSEPEGPAVW